MTVLINFLNAGFSILFRKGVNVAAVVATIVIAKVVDTVFIEGKYFSTTVVGSYCTTHSFVSSIYLKPTTFSVPFTFRSPIRGLFFLGSGHSTLSSSGIFGTSGVSVSAIGGCSTFVGGCASCIGSKSLALYCNGS